MRGLSEKKCAPGRRPLEPEDDPDKGCLPASVRACERNELPFSDAEAHVLQHALAGAVGERNVAQVGG